MSGLSNFFRLPLISGDLFSDCIGPRPPVARDVSISDLAGALKKCREIRYGVGYSNLQADFREDALMDGPGLQTQDDGRGQAFRS